MTARLEYRIAPGGRHAVCLNANQASGLSLETWTRSEPAGWHAGQLLGDVKHPQMLAMDDGGVLVYDSGDADPGIWLRTPDGDRERLTQGTLTDVRLVAAPRETKPGIAILYRNNASEIWELTAQPPGLTRRLATVPGLLLSGLRIDAGGTQLAIERADVASGPTEVVAVDLRDGSWSTLLDVTPESHDSILLADPRTQLVVVGTDATGVRRIGWTRLGEPEPELRLPAALNPDGEPVEPLAVSPTGEELLLHRALGTQSSLLVHRLADDSVRQLALQPAHVHGPAKWTADGLTVIVSTPTTPAHPITVSPTTVSEVPYAAGSGKVEIEQLAGADGSVEAIVYGGPDWRDSERLLIALHGGPLSAWRYEYDPLLHQLSEAGIAIVAPNQRGSIGYGSQHALAIQDAWGGPDLDDILRIATDLHAHRARRELLLYGHSYGAFLALLAAAAKPRLWAKCAVLAPFLSAESLYAQAGPGVRALIDRLGGRNSPADVLTTSRQIEADLLIAHGARDPMVPADQSRALRQRLLQHGREEGHDLHYLEPPDGTHELITDPAGPVVKAVVAFLAGSSELPRMGKPEGGEITWERPATFA